MAPVDVHGVENNARVLVQSLCHGEGMTLNSKVDYRTAVVDAKRRRVGAAPGGINSNRCAGTSFHHFFFPSSNLTESYLLRIS
jgi:hypothetical protein